METIKKKDIEDTSPKTQDLTTQFFFLFFQFSLKNFPSLPIVVVLPTPFTPETIMTVGLLDSKESKSLW